MVKLKGFIDTLSKMKHVVIVFLLYSLLVIAVSKLTGNYEKGFLNGFLVNANSSILDFFVLGVVLYYFEGRRQNKETISELLEDLENLSIHKSVELKIKKIKIIRQLNHKKKYDMQVPRMELGDLSTIKYLQFNGAELSGLNISHSNVRDCDFENCSIQALDVTNGKLKNVKFINCKLKNFKATNSQLLSVYFEGCLLEGSDFSGAKMNSCMIKSSDLRNAKYNDAMLRSANLKGSTNIDVEKLAEAKDLNYLISDSDIRLALVEKRPDIKLSAS